MIQRRPSAERGFFDHGWLKTHHTFSFAHYVDSAWMGFRSLRVLNDDRIDGGAGFGKHGHENMEIISYVVAGALEHKDSLGNGSVLRPGDIQRMTAGAGIRHSEWNASKTEDVHLIQTWILPERDGLEAGWEEKHFPIEARTNRFCTLVSPDRRDGSLGIHQDAIMLAGTFDPGATARYELARGRHVWIQIARGSARIHDTLLEEGDGAAVTDESRIDLEAVEEAEVLLFDLA